MYVQYWHTALVSKQTTNTKPPGLMPGDIKKPDDWMETRENNSDKQSNKQGPFATSN